jgi:prolyl-tRNA synthetase
MQNGWALQCGTSHFLGQNFAKAFDVRFNTENGDGAKELVWGTSWGVSTRLIGALVMAHSDDVGLVLPPEIAPIQVIVVPILKSNTKKKALDQQAPDENGQVANCTAALAEALSRSGVRSRVIARQSESLGALRFHWERKGVPIRIEVGPKDLQSNTVTVAVRRSGEKISLPLFLTSSGAAPSDGGFKYDQRAGSMEGLVARIKSLLAEEQAKMYDAALQRQNSLIERISDYRMMLEAAEGAADLTTDSSASPGSRSRGEISRLYLAPWRESAENEAAVKQACKMTIRCYPNACNLEPPAEGVKCFYSGKQATHYALFGRAF